MRSKKRFASPFLSQRQFADAHAGGVEDRVGDTGHRRDAGDFAGAFGAVVAGAGVVVDQRGFDAGHLVDRQHQGIHERWIPVSRT